MWIVKLALSRPYTFIVLALLILVLGPLIILRTPQAARMYEPGIWVPRVSPTPLLMVVALSDTVTVTDLALAAYERALEPKKLQLMSGGHFDPTCRNSTKRAKQPLPGSANLWTHEKMRTMTEGRETPLPFAQTKPCF
jgi:fermentation-respiration switch protein FrsA (DUF1100 family)